MLKVSKILFFKAVLIVFLPILSQVANGQSRKNVLPINEVGQYLKYVDMNTEGWVSVESYLPKNFDRLGNKDYTYYIQKAINENTKLLFPNFTLAISDVGLSIPSNRVLFFLKSSKIKLLPSNKDSYQILRFHNVKNVKVFNLNIEGDRYTHKNNAGEWGMGISIRESNSIQLYNSQISKCWGDGIYIGTLGKTYSSNISISGGVIEENRRNGISVISVDGLNINNLLIANTYGTNPQAGIDFEPNSSSDVLRNINLKSVKTLNNYHKGLAFFFRKLTNSNSISINIDGFSDDYSRSGITIAGLNKSIKKSISNGRIYISNSVLKNNLKPIVSFDSKFVGPQVVLDNVQVLEKDYFNKDKNRDLLNSMSNGSFKIL